MEKIEAIRRLHLLYKKDLAFCGCTAPVETLGLIRDILYIYEEECQRDGSVSCKEDKSNDMLNKLVAACNLKDLKERSYASIQIILNVLNNADLLSHDSSLLNSSLTKYGREIIDAFKLIDDLNIIFDSRLDREF